MEDNKKCLNCGAENTNDSIYCKRCGKDLRNKDDKPTTTVEVLDDSKGNIFGILSLILYFGASIIGAMFTALLPPSISSRVSSLVGLFPLAGLVLMIVGRVKYPSNKLLKIVMWIIIVTVILGIIAFIVFFLFCYLTCRDAKMRNCS